MIHPIFTVSVRSELTGREGSITIVLEPNPDGMLERLHEAVEECLRQIAGDNNGKAEKDSGAS